MTVILLQTEQLQLLETLQWQPTWRSLKRFLISLLICGVRPTLGRLRIRSLPTIWPRITLPVRLLLLLLLQSMPQHEPLQSRNDSHFLTGNGQYQSLMSKCFIIFLSDSVFNCREAFIRDEVSYKRGVFTLFIFLFYWNY